LPKTHRGGFLGCPKRWTEEGEGLCLLVERSGGRAIDSSMWVRDIRSAVVERCGVDPARIVVLEPGSLPRTSSGKIRRGEAARLFGRSGQK
jgi:acyl-CoA synthetase (AMP-forming)/AMP-acid ligase II